MSDPIVHAQSYGKSQVRLSRIVRDGSRHEIVDLTVGIQIDGEFSAAYTQADSKQVVPTDTMKNTVYVLASRHGVSSIESFALLLGRHFLVQYPHVAHASISCEQQPWMRLDINGGPHSHAFSGSTTERFTSEVGVRNGGGTTLISGFKGLRVLKTTGSEFSGFHRDEYTTLPETEDRILATTIEAHWPCLELDADWSATRQVIRAVLLEIFANLHSKSVQHTMFEMARAAFDACPHVDEISIRMPNEHHLLANLAPFGLANPNEVFIPTDEPFGDIRATFHRNAALAASRRERKRSTP